MRCGGIGAVGRWPDGLFLFEGEPRDFLGTNSVPSGRGWVFHDWKTLIVRAVELLREWIRFSSSQGWNYAGPATSMQTRELRPELRLARPRMADKMERRDSLGSGMLLGRSLRQRGRRQR